MNFIEATASGVAVGMVSGFSRLETRDLFAPVYFLGTYGLDVGSAAISTDTWTPLTFTGTYGKARHQFFTVSGTTITFRSVAQDDCYLLMGRVLFATNATGRRGVRYVIPSGTVVATELPASPGAGVDTVLPVCMPIRFVTGDTTMTVDVLQNSGGDLNVSAILFIMKIADA